jgi:hypothetical protein
MEKAIPGVIPRRVFLDAILEGGPADILVSERLRTVDAEESKIKLPHRGGYEHFDRTSERLIGSDGTPRNVYRWVMRTQVAE